MKVSLVASTHITSTEHPAIPAADMTGGMLEAATGFVDQHDATDADTLAEAAGRLCYLSWRRPNPATATNAGYLENIVRQGHFSVLEHASATFYVEGVSRTLSHELIRHRHLSFSEVSQRYVNVEDFLTVVPPVLRGGLEKFVSDSASGDACRMEYGSIVRFLTDVGVPRKRAREAARAILPAGLETRFIVTGNLRAWRDVLGKRYHVAADAEIREFAGEVLKHLRDIAPNTFADVPDTPYGTEA